MDLIWIWVGPHEIPCLGHERISLKMLSGHSKLSTEYCWLRAYIAINQVQINMLWLQYPFRISLHLLSLQMRGKLIRIRWNDQTVGISLNIPKNCKLHDYFDIEDFFGNRLFSMHLSLSLFESTVIRFGPFVGCCWLQLQRYQGVDYTFLELLQKEDTHWRQGQQQGDHCQGWAVISFCWTKQTWLLTMWIWSDQDLCARKCIEWSLPSLKLTYIAWALR